MIPFSAIIPNFLGRTLTTPRFNLHMFKMLGQGAYGVVYLAHNTSNVGPQPDPPFYAIKCLLKHNKDTTLGAIQARELAIHKSVSHHPNVVTLHEVIEDEHYIFLVMDYCSGGDLFGAIVDRDTYDHNDLAIKRSFLQMLDAMETCHSLGVFHRDLKPENILCSADNSQVYIADFGLATKNSISSTFGCGSSNYMSPESLGYVNGETPFSTAISDVWSLGIILINMITGRVPWRNAIPDRDAGFRNYLREGAAYLYNTLPMSREIAKVLGRVLKFDPAARMTIPELRKAIMKVETFRDTTAQFSFLDIGESLTNPVMKISFDFRKPTPSTASIVALRPSRVEQCSSFSNPALSLNAANIEEFPLPPPLVRDRANSVSDTDTESEGPATPVTRVQDPEIQVPDDLHLDEPRVQEHIPKLNYELPGLRQKKEAVIKLWTSLSAGYGPRVQRPVQKMVNAVQRVRALA